MKLKSAHTDMGQHRPSELCKDKEITLLDLQKVRPVLSSFSWGLFWWHDQTAGTRRTWDLGKKTQQVWDKFYLICTQVYIQDNGPGQKGSRIQDWDGVRLELLQDANVTARIKNQDITKREKSERWLVKEAGSQVPRPRMKNISPRPQQAGCGWWEKMESGGSVMYRVRCWNVWQSAFDHVEIDRHRSVATLGQKIFNGQETVSRQPISMGQHMA